MQGLAIVQLLVTSTGGLLQKIVQERVTLVMMIMDTGLSFFKIS